MKTETLIRTLASSAMPVRPLAHPVRRYLYWLALALCYVAALTIGIGVRADISSAISQPGFILQALSLLMLALAAALSAFYLGVPGRTTASAWWLPGMALSGCLLVFLVLALAGTAGDAGTGLRCLRNILLLSLAPATGLYLMLWRAFPLAGKTAGLLASLGALALGCLGTRFICPQEGVLHFILWHCVPVLALAAAGAVAGRFLLRKL